MNSTKQPQEFRSQGHCYPTVEASIEGANLEERTHLATIQGALSLLRRRRFDPQSSQAQRLMEIASDSTNSLLHRKEGLPNQQKLSINLEEAPPAQLQLYGASKHKNRKKSISIRSISKDYDHSQQLQVSETRFRKIVINSADGIFI